MNYFRSLIKHIIKILLLLVFFAAPADAQEDTSMVESEDTAFVMTKSPWGAVLRSAVIPGWGQIYNESYYKAPVIWGIGAWLVYNWVTSNRDYKFFNDLYLSRGNEFYRLQRTAYRDQRDLFTIYLSLLYLLNLVDAYVDAHLFDFTVDEDFMIGSPRITLKILF